ncbi:reverse transcriptase domain-containing protein [Tanacetum coccineum]
MTCRSVGWEWIGGNDGEEDGGCGGGWWCSEVWSGVWRGGSCEDDVMMMLVNDADDRGGGDGSVVVMAVEAGGWPEVAGKRGDGRWAENLATDHLSRLENPNLGTFTEEEITDEFPDEHLMILKAELNNDEPWYADYDEAYAFKLCSDNVMRRCVAGNEILEILVHCHSGPTGGHHSASITRRKVYESGFYWPSIFKDDKDYVMRCDACQRSGNISSRSEMPQNNIQNPYHLRKTILATARAMIDVFNKKIMLRVGNDQVVFDMDYSMKTPSSEDDDLIIEYLVNISKRRAFWSLNEDILKITILKTNTPYPSRKIRRICACTHQRPQRSEAQYAVSRETQYTVFMIYRKNINLKLESIKYTPHNNTSKSTKQSTTALSSTKVECIATAEASMKAVWMRKFIDGLRGVMPSNKRPMEMLCKNYFALAIASDPGILKGARLFQSKYHYIREVIQEGEIILKKVHTYDNVADLFTKPMPFNKHFEHAMTIEIVPASSLM